MDNTSTPLPNRREKSQLRPAKPLGPRRSTIAIIRQTARIYQTLPLSSPLIASFVAN
ncbi:MAG: hypothetical protein NC342_07135 [Pseudoflavonifractor sp.]|nr:hypothetical protein [Alloprevotella sp.]MCM1117292.1 hypothetical protein [Pseudoflavonifractor sp.]